MSRTRNNRPEILAQCKHPLRVCNGIPPDFHPKQCISPAQRLFLREPRCLRIGDPDDRGHRPPETLSGPPGSGCELVNEQMFDCMIMHPDAWTSTTTQDTPPSNRRSQPRPRSARSAPIELVFDEQMFDTIRYLYGATIVRCNHQRYDTETHRNGQEGGVGGAPRSLAWDSDNG